MRRTIRSMFVITVAAGVVLVAGCDRLPWTQRDSASGAPQAVPTPVRIGMAALHQAGGVPPGWKFRPSPGDPAAGRQVFVDYGCPSCHIVRGEEFPKSPDDVLQVGPELTGMGGHHPPEYFAESIINPNAVLVEGPSYIDDSGRSVMPDYPDMTLGELADVVSYLQTLRSGASSDVYAIRRSDACDPTRPQAFSYVIQAEEVSSEQLRAFDEWFAREGARVLAGEQGVLTMDAYVNRAPELRVLVNVFGFTDDSTGAVFRGRLEAPKPGDTAARSQGYAGRVLYRSPVVYKAVGITLP